MSWLSKIQTKSRAEKIRLIWIIGAVTVVILLALWILVGRIYNPRAGKLEFFDDLGKIIKNAKENKPNFTPPRN